jgi:hypothetical protein
MVAFLFYLLLPGVERQWVRRRCRPDGANNIYWIGGYKDVAPTGAGKGRPFGMIWLGNEQVHWDGGLGFTWFYRTPVLVETPGRETRIKQKSKKCRVHFWFWLNLGWALGRFADRIGEKRRVRWT